MLKQTRKQVKVTAKDVAVCTLWGIFTSVYMLQPFLKMLSPDQRGSYFRKHNLTAKKTEPSQSDGVKIDTGLDGIHRYN